MESEVVTSYKNKFIEFYNKNKFIIIILISIIVIGFGSVGFYFESKERKIIRLSEDYIKAKIYLENKENIKALDILKNIILANNKTYSTLSFFLILNNNLIEDKKELSDLFEYILKNNKYKNEIKDLLIYKKALFQSEFLNENEMIEITKPLMIEKNLWKPHALLLLGDYFTNKKEYLKAREFYSKIFSIKNLPQELYDEARSRLILISND